MTYTDLNEAMINFEAEGGEATTNFETENEEDKVIAILISEFDSFRVPREAYRIIDSEGKHRRH